jgi:DNA-binding MarR family transcriptional regulator
MRDDVASPVQDDEAQELTALVLLAANSLVDGIHAGVVARGFTDLRPAHGFAFARLAPSGATVSDLAKHLGVTRQAAGQLVDELVAKGYVARGPHPADGRARLVVLTDRGLACTRAAEEAAAEMVATWAERLGAERLGALRDDLGLIAPEGRLRPAW